MRLNHTIRNLLMGGKRLDPGRAKEVAAILLKQSGKTAKVIELLWDDNPGVANRAADALERASCVRPELLAPWKDALLGRMADAAENKLRWNLALMIPRAELTIADTERTAAILRPWLDDKSSIVKTSAMHGLAGLARWNPVMRAEVLDMLRILSRTGTPAMRARGRILLKHMDSAEKTAKTTQTPRRKPRPGRLSAARSA